jgi:hypothetical protein
MALIDIEYEGGKKFNAHSDKDIVIYTYNNDIHNRKMGTNGNIVVERVTDNAVSFYEE